jgi:hypothetical protein
MNLEGKINNLTKVSIEINEELKDLKDLKETQKFNEFLIVSIF